MRRINTLWWAVVSPPDMAQVRQVQRSRFVPFRTGQYEPGESDYLDTTP